MTPQDVVERIGQAAGQAGMGPYKTTLLGNEVLVARTSKFSVLWFATKLHTFLVASVFPTGTATPDRLDRFLDAAATFAKANKGGLPVGLQTGLAILPVAVTGQPGPEADAWASKPHRRRVGTVPFPVLVDATSGQVTRPNHMVIAGVYSRYLKRMVDQHVATPLRQPGPPM